MAYPEWSDYLKELEPVAERLVAKTRTPDDPQARQEIYRMMLGTLAGGYLGLVYNDPNHPDWVPMLNSGLNFAAPVPDFMYTYAPICGEGTYRIAGYRGSSLFVVITVSESYFTRTDQPKPGLANYDVDQLTLADDGWFEVILSEERPEGYTGDWWYLDPRATWVRATPCTTG